MSMQIADSLVSASWHVVAGQLQALDGFHCILFVGFMSHIFLS